ncbi:MAG TPA: c-type cytochrome [Solimonas sp.]|nr:c-type cytochrome [Solimonas sp.]
MKRVLLVLALCVPTMVLAEASAKKDPFTQGDAAAGDTKSAACGACHGPNGNSAMAEWPKLAGQSSRFVFDQLKAFKAGTRQNPVMQGQVAALSEQDMRDLAAHYALQKPAAGVASKDAVAVAQPLYRAGVAGRALPACGACHGPAGAGVAASGYPRLGGQHATYVAARLRAYRDLASKELPDGNQKMMAAVAAKLSDKEIDALASYVNGLQ